MVTKTAQHWILQILTAVMLFTQTTLLTNESSELKTTSEPTQLLHHGNALQHENPAIENDNLVNSNCNDTELSCDNCHHCHGSHVSLVLAVGELIHIEAIQPQFFTPQLTLNKIREGIDRPPIHLYL